MHNQKKQIIAGVLLILIFVISSWFISMGIVRVCANAFAKPDPYKWEWAYISTSPRAYSYHQSVDCKYLRRTNHNINIVSVLEADDAGRKPCSYCLENSRRHQYDKAVWYVTFPVFFLLIGIVAFIERYMKQHKEKTLKQSDNIKYNVAYPERCLKYFLKEFEKNKGDRELWFKVLSFANGAVDKIYMYANTATIINKTQAKQVLETSEILCSSGYLPSITVKELNNLKSFVDYDNDDAIVRKIIHIISDSKERMLFSISLRYSNESIKELKKMKFSIEKENAIKQALIDDVNRTVRAFTNNNVNQFTNTKINLQ